MASIIRGSDNFDSEGIVTGTAKAWVNFNGTGTVAIRDSYNVSSITDNGTGLYTASFANALSDINYSSNITAGNSSTASSCMAAVSIDGSYTTTSVGVKVNFANASANGAVDSATVSLAIFGN
jgi:hypothetical protein